MLFIEKILKEKDLQQRTKNKSVLINKKTNIQILEDVIIDFFKRNDLKIIVEKASVKIKNFSQEERLFERVEEIRKLKKDIKNLIRFFIKQDPEIKYEFYCLFAQNIKETNLFNKVFNEDESDYSDKDKGAKRIFILILVEFISEIRAIYKNKKEVEKLVKGIKNGFLDHLRKEIIGYQIYHFDGIFINIKSNKMLNKNPEEVIFKAVMGQTRKNLMEINENLNDFDFFKNKNVTEKLIQNLLKINSLNELLFVSLLLYIHYEKNIEFYKKDITILEMVVFFVVINSGFKFKSENQIKNFEDFIQDFIVNGKTNLEKWERFNN